MATRLRWVLPAALLLVEYLALSLLVDLPIDGSAAGLVDALRLAVPVVLSAGGMGWLMARPGTGRPSAVGPLPPWQPWPALALQPVAFAFTAALAWKLLGPGAPPVTGAALAGWVLCAAGTGLLALASAVPLGWAVRQLVFRWRAPLVALVLGGLAWRAAAAAEGLWNVFSQATLGATATLLRATGGRVTLDPAERVIGMGKFEVIVAPICSGVDGAGLVVVFLATWLALSRGRLRLGRALLLLPLGAVAALAANVVRIAVLLRVGAAGHEDLALGGFHSKLGWVFFLVLALGGVVIADRVKWLQRDDAPASTGSGVPAEAGAYLGPLLAALATAMVTGIFSAGPPDVWYGLRVLAALAVLAAARHAFVTPRFEFRGSGVPALIGMAAAAAWLAWPAADGAALTAGLGRLGSGARAAWMAQRVLGSILVIPLVEELAFRGFLLPWLVHPDFKSVPPRAWTVPAVAFSSLAFGALHAPWALATLAGVAFAVARLWRGRLADAVLAHTICNAGIAAAALWGGRLDLWS